jgi:OmpA-OmpF porin, OOP family
MNIKALLTILAFIALVLFGSNWWCNNKGLCGCGTENATITDVSAATATTDEGIVRFGANDMNATTGGRWEAFRDSICNLVRGGKRLEITGYYGSSETNKSTFLNLGLARADTIKKLFLAQCSGLNASRLTTIAAIKDELNGASAPFEASKINVLDTIATPSAAGGVVITDSNNMIVYFPSGSSAKETNPEVDKFLTELGARLKTSGQTAVVTGHTDNKGNPAKNVTLSKERAEFVKTILTTKGADASKLTTEGKGDAEPVGDNNTDAGRRQNRRVQIHIN